MKSSRLLPLLVLGLATTFLGTSAAAQDVEPEKEKAESAKSAQDEVIRIQEVQVSLIQNAFIAAPIPGVVAMVEVAAGDQIKSGSKLAELSSEQARAELEAAQAAYKAAQIEAGNDVDLRYATRTLEVRQREFQQSEIANNNFRGTISATELEKLRLVVDQSQLAIEQAEHELMIARAKATEKMAAVHIAEERLNKHAILTTIGGLVTEVDVEPGEWVEAGKPIVRIVSLDPIRIECFVDGRQHGPELIGKTATFTAKHEHANEATELTGKVTFVSPELHPVTGQVRLWATVDNPDLKVRAGMRGTLEIESAGN